MKKLHWILASFVLIVLSVPAFAQYESIVSPSYQIIDIVKSKIKTEYAKSGILDKQLEYAAIQGMVKSLNDPYTQFLEPDQYYRLKSRKESPNAKAVTQVKIFGNVGYIRLASFDPASTFEEMVQAIDTLQAAHVRSLVLDIRNNGGGSLQNAIDITGLFVANTTIATTVAKDGSRIPILVGNRQLYTGAMVLLINRGTASSAEVLAGAVKDLGRAWVVGENSYGKAAVQRMIDLPDGSGLVLTVAHYLTPKGTNIAAKGITVDAPLGGSELQVLQQAVTIALAQGYRRKR